MMRAKEIMTRSVLTVSEETRVSDIAKLLVDKEISGVPVVDPEGGLIGIVTEGDLLYRPEVSTAPRASRLLSSLTQSDRLAAHYAKTHGLVARDVMTRPVVTVAENTTLADIARTLQTRRVKRVPVLDDAGKIVGIVSRADIVRKLAEAEVGEVPTPTDDEAIQAAIIRSIRDEPWAQTLQVNVVVIDGVVGLWGVIDSDQQRDALRVIAERGPGVRSVDDHLTVASRWRSG